MLDLLKTLTSIDAASGREDAVSDFIINFLKNIDCTVNKDNLGNVIVYKKGKKAAKHKVMFSAHMDEVALIVTHINSDGSLSFSTVGGINPDVLCGRTVRLHSQTGDVYGVIGLKPIHLCSKDEEFTVPSVSNLVIDIGAGKEEVQKLVSLGDIAYFTSEFVQFGNDMICSKAIDDRVGCSIMLDMLQNELEYDAYFAFLVQEEVGLRGAPAAVYGIEPEYAIVLEATTASDIHGFEGANKVCCVGGGAVVSFADRSTFYDKSLFSLAFKIGKEQGIKVQTKTKVAGGNDAGAIHKAVGGVKTIAISLPCRYIHSASSIAKAEDIYSCRNLAQKLFEAIAND